MMDRLSQRETNMDKRWYQLLVNVRLVRAYMEVGHKGVATGRGE